MTIGGGDPPSSPSSSSRSNVERERSVAARRRISANLFFGASILILVAAQFLISPPHYTTTTSRLWNARRGPPLPHRASAGNVAARDASAARERVDDGVVATDDDDGGVAEERGDERTTIEERSDAGTEQRRRRRRPLNVLLLYVDDWRHDTLGVAGNPVVRTPRIDALAARGVRFTHACVTTSICGISRATLQTGQYFSRHKSNPHDPHRDHHPAYYHTKTWNERTLVGLLRQRGYFVGHVGKWHDFDNRLLQKRFDFVNVYYEQHVLPSGVHVTTQNERDAMEFLELHGTTAPEKPFFLNVAFFATHAEDLHPEQYIPQNESLSLYVNDTVPVSPNAVVTDAGEADKDSPSARSFAKLPSFISDEGENESRARWRKRYATPNLFQKTMRNMYRMATEVDDVCGRLLDELERRDLLDDTLVVFTADNGNFHGEHGLADKWYPHEESIRVPLIVVDPRAPPSAANTTRDELVLNVDLAPTLLAAAGVEPPPGVMQGRDMSPLWLDNDDAAAADDWRTEFYYEHPYINKEKFIPSSRALVRKDYKYLYWPKKKVAQLFRTTTDPYEETDLADDVEHAEILAEMGRRMDELRTAAA